MCGEWDNGFVIQRASDESEFVWIPVGHLAANGTLDGRHFTEKLGRRKYKQDDVFSDDMYHEDMNQELIEQVESVKKYGGFYISRYNISRSLEGEPQSIKGAIPWVEISFGEAKKKAATIESSETVTSHLTYGAEYDSVLQWFIQSRERHLEEIVMNSANWGNYSNTNLSPEKLLETGSNKEWCTNGIYDFAGNVDEWTQEKYNNSFCVIRGGRYRARGDCRPVAVRARCGSGYYTSGTGFRAVLCIK